MQKDPNPTTWVQEHHKHQLPKKQDKSHATGFTEKNDQLQQPGHELLEFRSPCWTPEGTLHVYCPKHSLITRPQILKHTIVPVFPDLPGHLDYQELRPSHTSFGTAVITFLHHPEKQLTEGSVTYCIMPKNWKWMPKLGEKMHSQPVGDCAWSHKGKPPGGADPFR